MKEKRLRKIVQASKERDMLLRMISLFEHNEDYYGRLEFYEKYATGNITKKTICVLQERLNDEEEYLRNLLNNTNLDFIKLREQIKIDELNEEKFK